jgi:predicted hotdog family 3-hydroxylacyl-ACP dehydratase
MLAGPKDIIRYLPQRSPMVMVDSLLEVSEDRATTQLMISPENIFVTSEHLAEPGLVENIAQTAAAHVGYQCSLKNIPIPIGYIASIRNLHVYTLPRQNTEITTSIKITNKVMDITVVQGSVHQDGSVLCSCEMRIFAKLQS